MSRAGVADAPTRHLPTRAADIGMFELWPLVEPPPAGEDIAWDAPMDYVSETAPRAVLAQRIAAMIQGWISCGEALAPGGRPIRAGDVLILVRRRNAFFVEMVRALKACGVPVAGADRLVLASHIAVQDLLALGAFVLLPGDDYALACLLKSPLCGLGDDDRNAHEVRRSQQHLKRDSLLAQELVKHFLTSPGRLYDDVAELCVLLESQLLACGRVTYPRDRRERVQADATLDDLGAADVRKEARG
jgi:ATP-dependent exoDNAse (exonuclease V) beta subunit